MNDVDILICVNAQGALPMRTRCWQSLDVDAMLQRLRERGKRASVMHVREVFNATAPASAGQLLFSATSPFPRHRAGFEAALAAFRERGGQTLPEPLHYLCYENKLLAASIAAARGCRRPNCAIVHTERDIDAAMAVCGAPAVWKLADGCGSHNVKLVRTVAEGRKLARRWLSEPDWGPKAPPSLYRRLRNKVFGSYGGRGAGAILVEQLLVSPGYDWKVLVWNDKANALRRFNR
ncbi:MAG: hypothetical protein KDA41_10365, partial [Planctomycetales bacterium]|nr:hypothetical protein [Planctomycetales bacterium]